VLRHVTRGREDHRFSKVLEGVQHDIDWACRAISASRNEVETSTDRPHVRVGIVFGATGDVTFSKMLREQCLYPGRDEGFDVDAAHTKLFQAQLIGTSYRRLIGPADLPRTRHRRYHYSSSETVFPHTLGRADQLPPTR
jgi:hypothetical protein